VRTFDRQARRHTKQSLDRIALFISPLSPLPHLPSAMASLAARFASASFARSARVAAARNVLGKDEPKASADQTSDE